MIFVKTFDTNTRQLLESDLQLHKQLKNLQFHIFFKILTPIKFISNFCHQNIKQISLLIFQRILQQEKNMIWHTFLIILLPENWELKLMIIGFLLLTRALEHQQGGTV